MADYYPPASFYFTVSLLGSESDKYAVSAARGPDTQFQEVSGIQGEWDVESVAEGGENRFQHKLPTRAKYPNLVLKRGAATVDSPLIEWAGDTIGSRLAAPIVTQNVQVLLLDASANPLIAWVFSNAYPVKWEVSTLDAQKNELLIETLELSYNYFERANLGDVPWSGSG